eukprot:COSAG01_NODE_12736_length_1692_cov_10.478970_2_plen_287_part_01
MSLFVNEWFYHHHHHQYRRSRHVQSVSYSTLRLLRRGGSFLARLDRAAAGSLSHVQQSGAAGALTFFIRKPTCSPPGPNSAAARVISENHGYTLRQHSAADSLLKVPSQRTAVILADPAVHSRRNADPPEADLRRSIGRRLITRPAGPVGRLVPSPPSVSGLQVQPKVSQSHRRPKTSKYRRSSHPPNQGGTTFAGYSGSDAWCPPITHLCLIGTLVVNHHTLLPTAQPAIAAARAARRVGPVAVSELQRVRAAPFVSPRRRQPAVGPVAALAAPSPRSSRHVPRGL